MPETALQSLPAIPLTSLSEDEILFRENVRQFAEEKGWTRRAFSISH